MSERRSDLTSKLIQSLYQELAAAPSLEPSEKINSVFSRLVEQCTVTDEGVAAAVLGDPEVSRIRPHLIELCSEGEYRLERYWAGRVAGAADPRRELAGFPYYANYERLTQLEAHALLGAIGREEPAPGGLAVQRVLFVGSGPLPLSSIMLAGEYGMMVDNVDSDPEACRLGDELVRGLGLPERLSFTCRDAAQPTDLSSYDAVFLAALVGLEEPEKRKIINRLSERMRPGALLVIRTAHQMRALLYPRVDPGDLPGFEPQIVVQPLNEVVNSVIVAEKSAQQAQQSTSGRIGREEAV